MQRITKKELHEAACLVEGAAFREAQEITKEFLRRRPYKSPNIKGPAVIGQILRMFIERLEVG